jgi:hypothetical protein
MLYLGEGLEGRPEESHVLIRLGNPHLAAEFCINQESHVMIRLGYPHLAAGFCINQSISKYDKNYQTNQFHVSCHVFSFYASYIFSRVKAFIGG